MEETNLMDQSIFKIAKVFFVLIFLVLSAGILYVDVFYLWERIKKPEVAAVKIGRVEGQNQVLIGDYRQGEDKIEEYEIKSADARPEIVRKYLEKYKSPLVEYADLIVKLSDTYGFEYYWIPAIAQQESNLCKKIPEGSHNCWGYGIHKNGTLRFENYELALQSYAEYLDREYFKKGMTTTEQIMRKYCPSSNGSWAFGVNKFIGQMESGEF